MLRALSLLAAGGVLVACQRADAVVDRPADDAPRTKPHKVGAVHSEAPGGPGEAMRWRMLRWRSADGTIRAGGLQQALAHRDRNVAYLERIDDAGIAPHGWTERGPDNLGGRTRALLIDPTDPNTMWAGAAGGGVWVSRDRGQSWNPIDDRWSRLAIGCLAADPSNPSVLYAGTGEGTYNGDSIPGDGIYRSMDRGQTWALLPATAAFEYTMGIAVSPANPNLILAATRGGVRRSLDGGATWTVVHVATNSLQVSFDPNDPTKAIAHAMDRNPDSHRVVRSTDSGATWSVAQTGLAQKSGFNARIELAYAASQPDLVYANCSDADGEIWRSTDGGSNWTLVSSGYGNPFGWYCNTIWVDPTDANFLIVGSNEVFRSTNGGQTLTRIASGYIMTIEPHPDVHRFVADPGYDGVTNRRLYVTTDGAVYGTDDIRTVTRNSGWYALDRSYRTTQFYGAAGHGGTGLIVGGTQDNGTLSLQTTANNDAVLTFGGDGGFCAVDATNPSYLYGEYVRLQIHRSSNGGNSASYIYRGISDAGSNANFIAPFVLDPNDQRRMLAGGLSLWRTNDVRASRPSWSAIKPSVGQNISAIAVSPGDADRVWVGHNDGRVYLTTNGTAASPTWTAVDDNGARDPFPNRYVGRILVDPDDPSLAWVALGGFEPDNLWRTADGGQSWSPAVGAGLTALPAAPINGIARHPSRAGWLYAATEVGVWASTDGGNTWGTNNDGPANTAVDEVVFMHGANTLLAATHGRGLWTIGVADCGAYVPNDEPGSGACNVIPFGAGAPGVRYQTVVTAADLRRPGTITDLGFAPCSSGTRTHARLVVRMSHVPSGYRLAPAFATNLPAPVTVHDATDWSWESGANTWSWLGLQRGFVYDGTSDVVVDVEVAGSQFTGPLADMRRDARDRLYAAGWTGSPPATGAISAGALKMAVSFGCPTISHHGADCGGLHIGSAGIPSLGGSYTLSVDGADPATPIHLNFGFVASGPLFPLDLAFIGLPGCTLWHDAVISVPMLSDNLGTAAVPIAVPASTSVAGAKIYAMALSPKLLAPGGLAVTGYLRIVHGL